MQTNVILAGLAVLLAIPTTYTLVEEGKSFTDFEKVPYVFDGFTPDNIQSIVLTRKKPKPGEPGVLEDKQLVFLRQGRRWVLGPPHPLAGAPIQGARVNEDLLERMRALRLEEKTLITANAAPEELQARELTPETGLLIQCLNAEGKPVAELYRGKDASGGKAESEAVRGFFVRPENSDSILLYEVPYWYVTVRSKDWIERTIHTIKPESVVGFTVRNEHGEASFERAGKDAPWEAVVQPDGTGAVRRNEVSRLLQRFTFVSCDRYLGAVTLPENAPLVPNDNTALIYVEAVLDDGSSRQMWVGRKIEGNLGHYAFFKGRRAQTDMLVAIHDALPTAFSRDPSALFDPSAERVGPPKPGPDPEDPDNGKD